MVGTGIRLSIIEAKWWYLRVQHIISSLFILNFPHNKYFKSTLNNSPMHLEIKSKLLHKLYNALHELAQPASSASSITLTFHLYLHYMKLIIIPTEDHDISYFQVYINFPFFQNVKFHAASPGKIHSFCHIHSLSTIGRLSAVCQGRIHWSDG